ncbi:carboxymuconolactone decarboxylase family protein [Paenibacillus hamazuiensis]|uniref:carboxymuconolactone decarboxylase family protein n=1 Tax=Paenibacillus hamazuiensis TaxID=2936508 RepID=UPI00200D2850|nr:carboxymuconolactone decarboxylase family protein [Paenibacillus hamazuiensis]
MEVRVKHREVYPEAYRTMLRFEELMASSGLDKTIYELIKIRASQINGCAFCLDMHMNDLRKMGESERRMQLIGVWRETPFFTDKEKAALELTEYVTKISEHGVPDELYNRIRTFFDEREYVVLLMAIITINSWNRLMISTGMFPGVLDGAKA